MVKTNTRAFFLNNKKGMNITRQQTRDLVAKFIHEYPHQTIVLLNSFGLDTPDTVSMPDLIQDVSFAFHKSQAFTEALVNKVISVYGKHSATGDKYGFSFQDAGNLVGQAGNLVKNIKSDFGGGTNNQTQLNAGTHNLQQSYDKQAAAASTKSNTGKYIAIAVGVIIVIGAGVAIYKVSQKK